MYLAAFHASPSFIKSDERENIPLLYIVSV